MNLELAILCLLPAFAFIADAAEKPVKGFANPLLRPYNPKNNLADCSHEAQEAIKRARSSHWGPFDFSCTLNSVAEIFTSTASPIANSPAAFVTENHSLFGVANSSISFSSARGGDQMYGQFRIAGTKLLLFRQLDASQNKDYFKLYVQLADTSNWPSTLASEPEVSDSALADRVYRKAVELWGRDLSEASAIESRTEIRADGCGTGKPALIQFTRIRDYPRKDIFWGVRVADGRPCNDVPRGD